MDRPDHSTVERQIQDVIQSLYQVMVQVSSYDSAGGRPTRDVLGSELTSLSRSLQAVHRTASSQPATAAGAGAAPGELPSIPQELIMYVENGRNPDIYTREFVEIVRRGNQLMRGKMHAFSGFRDVLAEQIAAGMPELKEDVAKVVTSTGGDAKAVMAAAAANSGSQ
ncbi:putative mediator of rna polymerase ii transcription subunit 10 protein [Phaeoacremonium minimum UCRPA7]|uniref:Mediator of RNA polymerase II transcription subunit 10 n=1 Tax=Phaeoacremonium minimum (strain UCR-PA7) TaxID=1286976 RepID=R8BXY7_PHAM7|nr:putative mediator of rna polymerase ii transcription subunit 10 protein [Phaeoacremonium minimum UCRPA7]EOO04144.1 putative mediator of rna polymerase ii transcription subunit 10 protein [Phaeoacremonium minimum UCRPA7]